MKNLEKDPTFNENIDEAVRFIRKRGFGENSPYNYYMVKMILADYIKMKRDEEKPKKMKQEKPREPIQIFISNDSTVEKELNILDVDILEDIKFPKGLKISSTQSGVSYKDILQSVVDNPFTTSMIRVQICVGLTPLTATINGDIKTFGVIGIHGMSDNPFALDIDNNTSFKMKILPNSKFVLTLFPDK